MAEKEKKSSGQAKTWFEGLRSEFKKIIWPDQKTDSGRRGDHSSPGSAHQRI